MTEWSFRVTPSNLDQAMSQCEQLRLILMPRALLVTKETGTATEKDHLHGYIELEGRTRMQLDYALSRVFSVKGAGQKQVADVRGQKGHGSSEKCLRYISKGESQTSPPNVVCRVGISEDDVASYHEQYWRVNEEVSRRPPVAEGGRKSMYEELKELVKEVSMATERFDIAMDWYRARSRHVSYHCFRDVVRKLCVEEDQQAFNGLKEKLWQEIFYA